MLQIPGLIPVVHNNYSKLQTDSCTDSTLDSRTTSPPVPLTREDIEKRLEEIRRTRGRRAAERLAQIRRAKALRLAPKARASFAEFVRQAWPVLHEQPLEWGHHLDVICDHAQALAAALLRARREPSYRMEVQRLLINIPPRMLKSELLGVFFTAWLWLKDPSLQIMYISSSEQVRTKCARDSRLLIASPWFRDTFKIGWNIRGESDAVVLYVNTCNGFRRSITYEANIVGQGCDVMILDDPQDASDAQSDVLRKGVNARWDEAISSRVNDAQRCLMIGIMQRLHEDDWAGHVLAQGGWRHVCLPMEFEVSSCPCADCKAGGSFLGRYDFRAPGELLHVSRFPESVIAPLRAQPYKWAGQYQQRPAPLEGGMFKLEWWRYYTEVPDRFRRMPFVFMDCQTKKNVGGSRTAIVVMAEGYGTDRHLRYVLDVIVGDMDIIDMQKILVGDARMKNNRAAYAPGTVFARWPNARLVVEDKAAGSDLVVMLKAAGINVEAWDPKNSSKESRANAITHLVEGGNVLLRKDAPWLPGFLHELSVFPNGKWDDQVDSLSMGLNYLQNSTALIRTKW